jgi:hypothetical protein
MPPEQALELGVEAGLILLHDRDVVASFAGQELCVLALAMHGIGGDHAARRVERLQQRGELGDLVGLAEI